jgi:hypothetical protein
VGADGLVDSGLAGSGVDGALQHRFMEVKALRRAKARVPADPRRRKNPLPSPLPIGVWVLLRQCVRELHASQTLFQITLVDPADAIQMDRERLLDCTWKHGDAVLVALALPNQDLVAMELDILDAQGQALHQPQARPIEDHGHDP